MNVLVTGCSSGFGELIARTLAKAGHCVFAGIRNIESRNAEVAAQFRQWAKDEQVDLHVVELDITDEANVQAAVQHILDTAGTIDVVVNNAAIAANGPIEAFTIEQMQHLYNTNIFGQLRVNQAVLPHMRERRSGLILQISSTLGRILPRSGGLYPASKWAIEGLTEALRYELAPFGVEVIILEPGSFPTPAVPNAMKAERQDIAEVYAPYRFQRKHPYGLNPPDPQMVADKVLELLEIPHGERPFRSCVGTLFIDGVDEYNEFYERIRDHQRSVLETQWSAAE